MSKQNSKQSLFPFKLNEILQNKDYESIIKWGQKRQSIQIIDLKSFQEKVLSLYFRHNNFESFIRQMNLYGFKKNRNSQVHIFVNSELKSGKQLKEIQSRNQQKKKKLNGRAHISLKTQIVGKGSLILQNINENLVKIKQKQVDQEIIENQDKNQLKYSIYEENRIPYYWTFTPQVLSYFDWLPWQLKYNQLAYLILNHPI